MMKALHAPVAIILCLVLIGGCNKTQLSVLTVTLANAVAAIADFQGNKEVADKLRDDARAITVAINAWRPGMPPGDVVRLVNNLIKDINLLPVNDKYRPFIILALGTAAHIIDILTKDNPSAGIPDTNIRLTSPPSTAREFKQDWNAIRASSINLKEVPIL